MRNVISFDLEHWHSATLLRGEVSDPPDLVERSTDLVLDRLDEHGTRATFFVVGEVAAEYPHVVAEVVERGHEVATHGHTHTPLHELDPEGFRRELLRSTDAIRNAADVTPSGFRAPDFSVGIGTEWAFRVLEEEGFSYDSSVFPTWTPMYGVPGAPSGPYVPSPEAPFSDGSPTAGRYDLVELPLAVYPCRVPLPVAGGFYLRMLPVEVVTRGIRALNRHRKTAVLYFHPWELNSAVPVDGVPFHKRAVTFLGRNRLGRKLDALLEAFEFVPAREVVTGFER